MFKRVAKLFFLFCLVLGIMLARLVVINEGGVSSASHTSNTISTVASETRGCIYDCNLTPLVNCVNEEYIAVKPSVISLAKVSEYIEETDKDAVYNEVSGGRIGIARANGSIDTVDAVTFSATMRYRDDGLAVHIIGYTDYDGNGVCGIEKYYNSLLSEARGSLKVKCPVDAYGNALDGSKMKTESYSYNSKAGVALTVDGRIQQICEDAFSQFGFSKGAVVVLDVATSQIKAVASCPEFSQNNVSASLNDENSPFVNRAVTPYSVGSVFKAVVAAAAVEKGIPTDTQFTCTGFADVGETHFGCHKETGHGTLDMFGGMAQSCNPYFINLALMTGKEEICSLGANMGLGKAIELCGGWYSDSGIMPSAQSIVSQQDLANLAFGQGELLATPLQMAAVYAAIANDGVYRAPSLMMSVIDENRVEIMRAELPASRRVMKKETAETVKSLLLETVNSGSGGRAKPDNITAAGKTATAQSGQFDENGQEITQSWFCGCFPYESPEYSIAILKENGEGGSADCAPVFKYIAERISNEL